MTSQTATLAPTITRNLILAAPSPSPTERTDPQSCAATKPSLHTLPSEIRDAITAHILSAAVPTPLTAHYGVYTTAALQLARVSPAFAASVSYITTWRLRHAMAALDDVTTAHENHNVEEECWKFYYAGMGVRCREWMGEERMWGSVVEELGMVRKAVEGIMGSGR